MRQFIHILFVSLFTTAIVSAQSVSWQNVGPFGGEVNDIITLESGVMYAGTTYGGIYRSTDGGMHWELATAGLSHAFQYNYCYSLETDADGVLYAGTHYGLYRTTDDGATWTQHTEGLDNWTRIQVLLNDGNGTLFGGVYNSGVYRSTDRGETWSESNEGLSNTSVNDLAVDSEGRLYAATENGLFRSIDNGDSWTEMSEGLEYSWVNSLFITPGDTIIAGGRGSSSISVDHGATWTPGLSFGWHWTVYADADGSFYAGGNTGIVFKSTDRGSSYETVTKVPDATFHRMQPSARGGIIAATENHGVIESMDGGLTWESRNSGLAATDVIELVHGDAGLFAGTYEGVYHSTDDGATWMHRVTEESGVNFRALGISSSGRLFGSASGVISISDDNGVTWRYGDSTLTETWADCFGFGPNNTVYACYWDGIFRSTNGGDSWSEISKIEGVAKQVCYVTPAGSIIIGTRKDGLFRSTDGGLTFTQVPSAGWDNDDHTAIIEAANGDLLLTNFNGVFRSSDDGVSWTMLGQVPTYGVKDIAEDSKGNLFIASRGGGVAVSTDGGATWTEVNDELGHLVAYALYIDDQDNIYVGTRGGGVFKGRFSLTAVEQTPVLRPSTVTLHANYPNPFNPGTTIPFTLSTAAEISLIVYDALGRKVATIAAGHYGAGTHRVYFDAKDLPGGVYSARLSAGASMQHIRMLLLK
ncbi:T9SS type A sorting domain-containing protein [bacterium]|nr:T9SS type A sorting domain-containing protein [bacterium]